MRAGRGTESVVNGDSPEPETRTGTGDRTPGQVDRDLDRPVDGGPRTRGWRNRLVDCAVAGVAAVVGTWLAAMSLGVTRRNLGVPWSDGDILPLYSFAKAMIDQGWWTPNIDLGFPFGQDGSHFPNPEYVSLLIIKMFAGLFGNPFTAVNLFFLVSFGLISAAMYLLLRIVRVNPWLAFPLALAFAWLPWHFNRFSHALLANYSGVATGLVLVFLVLSGRLDRPWNSSGQRLPMIVAVAAGVYTGLSGVYYAVFIMVVCWGALVVQWLAGRRFIQAWRSVLASVSVPVVLVVALFAVKLSAMSPVVQPLAREGNDSWQFGGYLYSLLRIDGLSPFARVLPEQFREFSPKPGTGFEGDALLNTVCFAAVAVALLLLLLRLASTSRRPALRRFLSAQTSWLVSLAVSLAAFTAGGMGLIFATTVSPLIRSWGRMSVVVVGIALVLFGLGLTTALGQRGRRWAVRVGGVVLAGIAVVDLLGSTRNIPIDARSAANMPRELTPYLSQAEAELPDGCAVLELPVTLYPEYPPVVRMNDYDSLWPYLFNTDLKWSYGTMRTASQGSAVFDEFGDLGPRELAKQAPGAGFCAVQVDTFGYEDPGRVLTEYRSVFGAPVATSRSGRWVMFRTADAGGTIADRVSR